MQRWIIAIERDQWLSLPFSTLTMIVRAKNEFLRKAVLDYERSTVLATGVAVIICVLIPFASLANAILGGSPALLYWYLLAVVAVIALATIDAKGLKSFGSFFAAGAVLTWGILLPLYAIWSLTTHFMGGALQNAAVAGLIIGAFLYAVLAVSGSMFRDDAGNGKEKHFGTGAVIIVTTPFLYVLYWVVLIAAAGQNVDVTDRSWLSLTVFVLSGVLFLAAANLLLNRWQRSQSQLGGAGLFIATFFLAGLASIVIAGMGEHAGMTRWLSMAPLAIWAMLPMCLLYCGLVKLVGVILPTSAATRRSAFFVPGLALCVTSILFGTLSWVIY